MSSLLKVSAELGLVSAALVNSAPVAHHLPDPLPAVVTVTKVKTPWYALPFLLRRGFRRAVPEYQQVPGLQFKYFASTAHGKLFGGIYLWDNEASARRWFGDEWFARVRRTYGAAGQVAYYPLLRLQQLAPATYDFGAAAAHCAAVFLHNADARTEQQASRGVPGLLRLYVLRESEKLSLILLFESARAAVAYLATRPAGQPELFDTPVLLRNEPQAPPP